MKIGVIGGASTRTPLLVRALARAGLPLAEVALYDPDEERLPIIASLTRHWAGETRVVACASAAECIDGAAYVFISIRVGGIDARVRDEATALQHGIVGQETVGPGGFAMAMRTIPHLVAYAREVAARAPTAWIINFTNPVGIVTQAVTTATGARIVGICDTPIELFGAIARALGVAASECYFDYFGLNHLGWVREVYHRGEPMLGALWRRPDALAALYAAPLFDGEFLAGLRLLPTEYLYYYYRPDEAVANLRRAGRSRGAVVRDLNAQLFEDLRRPGADAITVYETYLAARSAGYLQIESGAPAPTRPPAWDELQGYGRIALTVVRAMHATSGAIVPLNVPNRGNLTELEDEDVVEVPCVVNANGAWPLHVGAAPAAVRDLLRQVKAYERATVTAALAGDADLASAALARHPLVGGRDLARQLLAGLQVT